MDYIIAGFRIRIDAAIQVGTFSAALQPFQVVEDAEAPLLLDLRIGDPHPAAGYHTLDTFDFRDANADCTLGRDDQGYLFSMTPRNSKEPKAVFRSMLTSQIVHCSIHPKQTSLLRFGLWMSFGLAMNPQHAVAIHASVIRHGDSAVLFLGESGTGKSTHTRLWQQHIAGAELLNDDSPIVRLVAGVPTVFGSPWSGKTNCYRNEHYPISAIVRLSQAPHNQMQRLSTIASIGALLPSCPPSFAFDTTLEDNLCATLSEVIANLTVYHLACLPDQAAAELSYKTIFKK